MSRSVGRLLVPNVDQLSLDADARVSRVQLVIAHTPFGHAVTDPQHLPPRTTEFPVLLVAGYANQPEDFGAGLADFHSLLERLEIEGLHGLRLELAPVVARE